MLIFLHKRRFGRHFKRSIRRKLQYCVLKIQLKPLNGRIDHNDITERPNYEISNVYRTPYNLHACKNIGYYTQYNTHIEKQPLLTIGNNFNVVVNGFYCIKIFYVLLQ